MNPTPARLYSSFPALLIFFAAVSAMDIDQMITVHARKLALMQEYDRTLQLQREVDAQAKWVASMKRDLLQLAPGDPEASAVVSDLQLRPQPTGK
jgi:hypothetical protein